VAKPLPTNNYDCLTDTYTNAPVAGDILVGNGSEVKVYSGTTWSSISSGADTASVHYTDSTVIGFDDGSTITGKELRICMKMLLKQAMKEMPEEFI